MSPSSSIIWLLLHHHLTWCHRWPITSSWNLPTIVSWSSSILWALLGYQSNSWWEVPSLPLDELCYHRQLYCLPSKTNLFMFCVIPWVPCYPTFGLLYLGVLPSFISRISCLAHPAGGPMVIDSFSARLSILPWGNCKTYSTSYSWWILCVSKV